MDNEIREKLHSDFYPRPPRGGRLEHIISPYRQGHISIHALREEGDIVVFASCIS